MHEDDGLLLVDTAWGEIRAVELLDKIAHELGLSVHRAIVTHVHYDRIAGIDVLEQRGVKVLALPMTQRPAMQGEPVPDNTLADLKTAGDVIRNGRSRYFIPAPGTRRIILWCRCLIFPVMQQRLSCYVEILQNPAPPGVSHDYRRAAICAVRTGTVFGEENMTKPVCAVVGVGPGNGAAFARRFAQEGYRVALLARSASTTKDLESELEGAKAYACDSTDSRSIDAAFDQIERDLSPVNVLIYNAGSGDWSNVERTDPAAFEAAWRINALGCLLCSQRVIPNMHKAANPGIVIIGATASLKGNAGFTAFASAKAAQRSLAQSMARHLDPQGIHVAYVIIDGIIDLPRTRRAMSDAPDEAFMNPDHIAEAVHYLTTQQRSAWTFELDLRPFGEKW